jgi:hypothetical protein
MAVSRSHRRYARMPTLKNTRSAGLEVLKGVTTRTPCILNRREAAAMLQFATDRVGTGVPLSLEPKRTLRSGYPKEFFWGVGIAKRPEVAPQDRIGHCEVVASKHVEMLVC